MAFGFTPHFTTDIYLDQLTPQQLLALSVDIVGQLGWKIRYVSNAGFIAVTSDKLFKWKAEVTLKITDDHATIRSESLGNEMWDLGKNKKMVEKFTNIFYERRNGVAAGDLAEKYDELQQQLIPTEKDILTAPPETAKQKAAGIFSLFVPRPGYFITPIIVDLNIALFIIMALSGVSMMEPTTQDLIHWGANVRFYTLDGGWWRLITCCFVHLGIPHLLFNMYALLYIGLLLEPYLGKLRFTIAYLSTGVVASLASLYMHDATVSVGASGAIFGMYGVFLAMLTTNVVDKRMRGPLMLSIGIFVVYNLAYGMKGGIDNSAHVGGLVSGLIIGYLFYPGLRNPQKDNYVYGSIGVTILFVLAVSFMAFRTVPNDIVQYQKKMETAALMERRALHSLGRLRDDSPKELWITLIRDSALRYWDSNITILHQLQGLRLPPLLKQRTGIFIDYCNLQIARLNYISRQIETTGHPEMDDSLQHYTTRINEVLASLKENK